MGRSTAGGVEPPKGPSAAGTVRRRLARVGRGVRASIPYAVLVVLSSPILLGYAWLLIATFSRSTRGLRPVGGWTLDNWRFLVEQRGLRSNIWVVTFNTFVIAVMLAVIVVGISALAGYALSRLKFAGRRAFLSMALVMHAFPSVTLLIAIFFVLRVLRLYDTLLGVTLVQAALELPLGIWLMKGFFDTVPWDVERAALIDGGSRLRAWWDVVLPLVRPGIAALSIFCFISGWGAFLIPYTFTTREARATIAVYLNNLMGSTRFVNYGEVAAAGLFQLLPILLFFVFAQEYLLKVFSGGTKGGT